LANTSRLTAARSVAGEHLHGPRLPAPVLQIQRRPTSSARGTREQLPDPRCCLLAMAAPLVAGLAVAAAALAGRYSIQAWHAYKARPIVPRMRKFYEGGFQPTMTRREAALILGVRETVSAEKIKEAHKRVMVANHPDAGGSHYLASKINEAKDILAGKTKGGGSAF
ncbi:unnamed protein product, partial [Urochloa humidicola]